MIELRKIVVFLFVTILLFHMIRLLYFSMNKWKFKTYAFIILLSGLIIVEIATFLDVIAPFLHKPFIYIIIKFTFTLGTIIFVIGIILWSNFTNAMMTAFEDLSLRDSLTGVLNRSGIEKTYEALVSSKTSFYVIVCDLDGTKRINDTYGHIEGDKFINTATKIINNEIRLNGYLSRIGGDEFVILLKYAEIKEIENIITTIKLEIRKIYSTQNAGISIGYALYPNDGITFKDLLYLADKKMYANKKSIKL